MAEELETTDEQTPSKTPPLPEVTAPLITDRFLFVDVAAMRAKQLRRGARPRLGEHHDPNKDAPIKPERIAMEEVRRGVVQYRGARSSRPRLARIPSCRRRATPVGHYATVQRDASGAPAVIPRNTRTAVPRLCR